MKRVSTNQGVVSVVLIVIGAILIAILIGFFTYGGLSNPFSVTTPSPIENGAPIYPNISVVTLPPGCTETSAYSVTTGKPCYEASVSSACGLTILTPGKNQTIGNGSVILGKINGCGWSAFEAQAGTAQAFKSNGVSVSDITILEAQGEWMQTTVNFKGILSMPSNPASGTSGYLLFKNEDASGMNPQTYKLPIKF